jgi:dihydroorotate dehydrogenase (NAD+) catalytic subunit
MDFMRRDLNLSTPWLNAAGALGFAPSTGGWGWPAAQAAFITAPISLKARSPAENRILLPYPGGFLLHTGLSNPGLNSVLARYGDRWRRQALPVWVHLLADTPADVFRMVQMLEGREEVAAVEVSLPPEAAPAFMQELVAAAAGELPVVAALPLDQAEPALVLLLAHAGASAVSLNAPRGCLMDPHGRLVHGRLYGPAVFPLALQAVDRLKGQLPLMAGGGVYSLDQGHALLQAGATAVLVDVALWLGNG